MQKRHKQAIKKAQKPPCLSAKRLVGSWYVVGRGEITPYFVTLLMIASSVSHSSGYMASSKPCMRSS